MPAAPPAATIIRLFLFPLVLSQLYRAAQRFSGPKWIPELTASPALLLVPSTWRVHFALYAVTATLLHTSKRWMYRKYLPPVWILNSLGNAWLIWSFLFEQHAFPSSYARVILSHSRSYVPRKLSREGLTEIIIASADRAKIENRAGNKNSHTFVACSKLHPAEPSCLTNYALSMICESLDVWKWVGGFGALSMVLTRRAMLKQNPRKAFLQWVVSTIRGTAFVVGSISTSWAMLCLYPRVLAPHILPRTRILFNGFVASLWILILPDARRAAIALYVARLAALSLFEHWKSEGGHSMRYGEILLFAASWAHLMDLKRKGESVGGLLEMIMHRVEKPRSSIDM